MGFMAHWYLMAMQHPYDTTWTGIGFLGQGIFGVRFVIQWLRSEIEGRSVIPIAFWYCSLGGGLITLFYAIHIQSAPFIAGQTPSLLIYCRNLYLVYRERERRSGATAA